MSSIETMSQKYRCKVDTKNAKQVLASGAVLLVEIALLSILEDKELSKEARKQKLDTQSKKVSSYAEAFGADIKRMVFPRLMSEGMGKLLS